MYFGLILLTSMALYLRMKNILLFIYTEPFLHSSHKKKNSHKNETKFIEYNPTLYLD
jgi:hypothetical protein